MPPKPLSARRDKSGTRGGSPRTMQRPNWYLPGLSASPWHDPAAFSWTRALEAAAPAIKRELMANLRLVERAAHPMGEELAGGRWSALMLYENGRHFAGCMLRVGCETRTWREGKCLVFDDSFEHEAINPTGHVRVVLLVDVWHPELTRAARARVAQMYRGERSPRDVGLVRPPRAPERTVLGALRAFTAIQRPARNFR